MEDLDALPAYEMMARRHAAEKEIGDLLGQLVFGYSRFVDAINLCVGWRNNGSDLENVKKASEATGTFQLLQMLDAYAREAFGAKASSYKKYRVWLAKAHRLREQRNLLMHSRWYIEAYGRHATAISTPILVEPVVSHVITPDVLRDLCATCGNLVKELSKLRAEHPL
ncbi:hypothetical protein [Lysobacter xanthus]